MFNFAIGLRFAKILAAGCGFTEGIPVTHCLYWPHLGSCYSRENATEDDLCPEDSHPHLRFSFLLSISGMRILIFLWGILFHSRYMSGGFSIIFQRRSPPRGFSFTFAIFFSSVDISNEDYHPHMKFIFSYRN